MKETSIWALDFEYFPFEYEVKSYDEKTEKIVLLNKSTGGEFETLFRPRFWETYSKTKEEALYKAGAMLTSRLESVNKKIEFLSEEKKDIEVILFRNGLINHLT